MGRLGMLAGVLDVWRQIVATEGVAGLQRGLSFVLVREGSKNAFRLGLFDPIVQLLEQGHQAPDHPIVPGIPETDYIKSCFVRSLTGFF